MQSETVDFVGKSSVVIEWNASRVKKFGYFPVLEVWLTVDGKTGIANIPAFADAEPPATTQLSVDFGGAATGFIVIK